MFRKVENNMSHEKSNFLTSESVITVDYGRGMSPILPLSIECGITDTKLNECHTTHTDNSECPQIAGVDCGG